MNFKERFIEIFIILIEMIILMTIIALIDATFFEIESFEYYVMVALFAKVVDNHIKLKQKE